MKELSLHILDIFYNSLSAGADTIKIGLDTDTVKDTLTITIEDNGKGMSETFLNNVLNPFTTTRTTRKVGLGLPLFSEAAKACNGSFDIVSQLGKGTTVTAVFQNSHIDRAPLGDMAETVASMVLSLGHTRLIYTQSFNGESFTLDTREVQDILGEEVSIQSLEVISWIKEYVQSGIESIMEV